MCEDVECTYVWPFLRAKFYIHLVTLCFEVANSRYYHQ
jgi:hypothetical protein